MNETAPMKTELTVSELRALRHKLEGSIQTFIVKAVDDFREVTGLAPRAIDVEFVDCTLFGDPARRYAVSKVSVDLGPI